MSTLAMEYGSSGRVNTAGTGLKLAAKGEITDASVVDLIPDVGGYYLLATKEFNASTGARRGAHLIMVTAPEEATYGSEECYGQTAAQTTNTGVTITYNADSTISISRSSATFAVRYAFYKVF